MERWTDASFQYRDDMRDMYRQHKRDLAGALWRAVLGMKGAQE